MKVIELSNKVFLVRHWWRWYRVQRGAAQWERLQPIIKNGRLVRPGNAIDRAAESLAVAHPVSHKISLPDLDK